MATNKTRLAVMDVQGASPYQLSLVTEFEIYQDAIDYVETFGKQLASDSSDSSWYIYLLSYDNPSYVYYRSGASLAKSDFTFPNNI